MTRFVMLDGHLFNVDAIDYVVGVVGVPDASWVWTRGNQRKVGMTLEQVAVAIEHALADPPEAVDTNDGPRDEAMLAALKRLAEARRFFAESQVADVLVRDPLAE